MSDKTEIYRGAALMPKNSRATFLSLLCVALFCAAMFIISAFIPLSWLLELFSIAVAAVAINKILKEGAFTQTYILTEEKLTAVTRYGLIELVTGEFPLKESVFEENFIIYENRRFPFYPDAKLKELLKTKKAS